jgi:glycosyltransferase involved in cell wall biosynthesis
MPAPELSVIVTTYNRPNALRAVLDGLLAQSRDDFEVIVADDGSGEPTRTMVDEMKKAFSGRLLHAWQEDRGFRISAARNLAAQRASGSYLVFLDGDCVPRTHFVETYAHAAHPRRILRGSRVLCSQRLTERIEGGLETAHLFSHRALRGHRRSRDINRFSVLRRGWLDRVRVLASAMRSRNWKKLRGCNFMVPASAYAAVGGCDESFEGWGYEDSDLCIRLMNLGLRIWQAPAQTCVLHLWHKENAREFKGENLARLQATLRSGRTHPVRGITPPAST